MKSILIKDTTREEREQIVRQSLWGDRLIVVTGADASVPERELNEAVAFCKERGIRHIVCNVDPLKEEGYRNNSFVTLDMKGYKSGSMNATLK